MKIRFREDGPLVIDLPAGSCFVYDGKEYLLEKPKLALCRCGRSKNKPFCDGSHKELGFKAAAGVLEFEG